MKKIDHIISTNGIMYDVNKNTDRIDFAFTMKATLDGIAICNSGGEFIYTNDSYLKTYGYDKPEEIIGKNWRIIHEKKELKRFVHEVMPALYKKGSWLGETTAKKRDGTIIYQELALTLAQNGNIIRIVRDITERKRTLKALEESELKYRSLLANLHEAVLYQNNENIILFANKRFCELFGYKENELINSNGYSLLYDKKDIELINKKNRLREKGISDNYEIRLKKKNGELVWCYLKGTPYYDIKGKIIGSITLITDITEQKNSSAALKASEVKFQAIFENSVDAIGVAKNGINIMANPAFLSLFGYKELSEIIGMPETKLIAKSERKKIAVYTKKRLKGDTAPQSYISKGIRKDGTEFNLEVHVANYKSNGEVFEVGILRDITEIKNTEEALRESELKYRSLIEYLHEAVFYVNNNAIMMFANKRCCELFGYELDELIGINSFDLLYDKKDIPMLKEKNRMREQGISDSYEIRCRKKNGEMLWCHIKGAPYFNVEGKIVGSITIVTDITEEKKYKDALKETETKFQTFFMLSIDAICVSINSVIILANPAYLSLFGYESYLEIEGKSEIEFIAFDERKRINEYKNRRARGEHAPSSYVTKGIKKDGKIFALEVHVSGYELAGEIYEIAILRDITELEQAQKALRDSEENYRTLINTSPDAIIVTNLHRKIIFLNQSAVDMFGFENNYELIGKKYADLIHHGERSDEDDLTNEILLRGYLKNVDRKMLKKNGTIFPADLSASLIRDSEGKPKAIISIIRDITKRKQIESQLKKYAEEQAELNATKDKFYSIIAHDLKSPFQNILGYSDMLKDNIEKLKPVKITGYATNIYDSARETFNLLENLLQWTGSQTGRLKASPEVLYVKELINSTIKIFRENAKNKKIKLTSSISNDLFIKADRNMVMAILRNLVSNAIKFTHKGGNVNLIGTEKDGKIFLMVTDSGVGLSDEDIMKIFSINKTHTTLGTEKERGTGLGLVICKEFAEKNNGNLEVESQTGKGSKFILSLPAIER